MARRKQSRRAKYLRCEHLEPRLVLSAGLGLAAEPLLHSPGTSRFDGVDDMLTFEDRPEMNTNEYTISLWFKADDLVGTQSLIARGEDWATDKAQWVLEINDANSPGKLQLWYEDAKDGDHYFAAPTTIKAGKWYNAIVTRSADGMVRIYVDGQQVYQKLDSVSPATSVTPVLIGARTNQPRLIQDYFDGTIQNVQVYNYAMTPAQVAGIVPAPRLELSQPVDGQVFQDGQIDLALTTDRPLTTLSYSIDGSEPISLIEDNWVYQENPDSAVVRSLNTGDVVFEYVKPQYAVGARWQYSYSTAAGTFTAVDDLPQAAWNYDAAKVSTRVLYPGSSTTPVRTQYNTGTWQNWQELGLNNPGGNGDNAAALYDGNWSTGAAYHYGARQWMTTVSAGTSYVKFNEEAVLWNVHLVEDAVQRTIDVAPGVHTMTVSGTDTLGKTSSLTVTFTVEAPVIDVNGDFETGELGPWVLTDSGAVVTADLFTPNIAPAGGDYMGYITTGLNELPSDLHFVDIDGNGAPEREYSALSVEVSLPSAAIVDVDLNFLTSEIYGGGVGGSDLLVVTTGAITDTSAYKLFFAVADSRYTGTATPHR